MAKLISPDAIVSKQAKLEHPVRVFAFAGIQRGAEIGRYTYINRHTFISGNARIGRYCSFARAVEIGALENPTNMLSTHPFQYSKLHFDEVPEYTSFSRDYTLDPVRTHIGHDVTIGAKGIIKGGVSVGIGAVVRANSFVNEDVRPYAIVSGSPARVIGYRFAPEIIARLLESNWWDLRPDEMQGMNFDEIELVLEQVQDALEQKRQAKRQAEAAEADPELLNHPVVMGLKQSLQNMQMPDVVLELVMEEAPAIAALFDPSDKNDEDILRKKLGYLERFMAEREPSELSVNEKKHIASLFRQKT